MSPITSAIAPLRPMSTPNTQVALASPQTHPGGSGQIASISCILATFLSLHLIDTTGTPGLCVTFRSRQSLPAEPPSRTYIYCLSASVKQNLRATPAPLQTARVPPHLRFVLSDQEKRGMPSYYGIARHRRMGGEIQRSSSHVCR